MPHAQRNAPLEALRGLAAIIVLLWHTMLGFFPSKSGIFDGFDPDKAAVGKIWFGLIYGTPAVVFFFVLSGYVLTRGFFLSQNPFIILRGAVKRWPRLAGTVTVATLTSSILFALGLYHYQEAGRITGSPWLATFATGAMTAFTPSIWDAFTQGSYFTFFRGDAYYDTSLWTMRYEFIGSFIAFGLALLLSPIRRLRPLVAAALLGVVAILCHFASPYFVAFPVGVMLAALMPEKRLNIPTWGAVSMIILAIYLWGYTGRGVGAFAPLNMILPNMPSLWLSYVYMIGAVLMIVAVESTFALRQFLSKRWALLLGQFSFPLYLIHVLVLCSIGSLTLVLTNSMIRPPYPNIIAAAVTIAASMIFALPLVLFERWWVRLVNRESDRLLSPHMSSYDQGERQTHSRSLSKASELM
ncbi:acyltransferase family protein [Microvirga mediterraneensis]|uniref:Acyltransferase n=1 Tax=Microvirga mediterraneensis TaxID=2754695 RepID=A0A838BRJ1_9HYPH|nr:acyltransferase [Microvirga mediterraneensis]MBA1158167.1 acyltransferase [Microvirga mediterraneensis]